MRQIPRLQSLFRVVNDETAVPAYIDDEISFHIEMRVDSLIASGATQEEARHRAELEFGDVESTRSELASIDRVRRRRERRAEFWRMVGRHASLALRAMRRDWGFAVAMVLTLALAIGVNLATFAVTDRVLLSPPPHVTAADDVVRVLYRHTPGSGKLTNEAIVPYADYAVLRDSVSSFSAVAAYSNTSSSVLGRGEDALELQVVFTTSSLFTTLGVQPALGRFYTASEDALPVGQRVVVLSHEFWESRFRGDSAVIGGRLEIDYHQYEVVGVAPQGFNGMNLHAADAWIPVSAVGRDLGGDDWHVRRAMHWLYTVARLAPGATVQEAQANASSAFVAANEERFINDPSAAVVLGSPVSGRAPAVGTPIAQRSGRIALWLFGVSALVLLIAFSSSATLLLTRRTRPPSETVANSGLRGVHLRLAAPVLIEIVMTALLGWVLGLLLVQGIGSVGSSLFQPELDSADNLLDGRVLLVGGLIALISMVVAALMPAWYAMRSDTRGSVSRARRGRYRRSKICTALVGLQMPVALVLLVGAGLFVDSFTSAKEIALGYEPDRVVLLQWRHSGLNWDSGRVSALYDASLKRVRAVPGVEAAAVSTTVPMWSTFYGQIRVPGLSSIPEPPGGDGPYFSAVSPNYFGVMGARLIRGREFANTDVAGSTPVAIVTETMAQLLWPGRDPVGECFVHVRDAHDQCRKVVGVVETTRHIGLTGEPSMMYFLPLAQQSPGSMRTLVLRTRRGDNATVELARRALQNLEPEGPYVQVNRLSERLDPQLSPWQTGAVLFTVFGILILILTSLGLHRLIMYEVTERQGEVRVGGPFETRPPSPSVLRTVLVNAFPVIALGLLAGLGLVSWGGQYMEPLLFKGSYSGRTILLSAAGLLLCAAMLAAALPALRTAPMHSTCWIGKR